jgi:hypothetical protein
VDAPFAGLRVGFGCGCEPRSAARNASSLRVGIGGIETVCQPRGFQLHQVPQGTPMNLQGSMVFPVEPVDCLGDGSAMRERKGFFGWAEMLADITEDN